MLRTRVVVWSHAACQNPRCSKGKRIQVKEILERATRLLHESDLCNGPGPSIGQHGTQHRTKENNSPVSCVRVRLINNRTRLEPLRGSRKMAGLHFKASSNIFFSVRLTMAKPNSWVYLSSTSLIFME